MIVIITLIIFINFVGAALLKKEFAVSSTHNNKLKYLFIIPPISIFICAIIGLYILGGIILSGISDYFKK
jgi:uncharacterized membrane protein YcfT